MAENYWDHPTGTDATPSNNLITPDPGNNAHFEPLRYDYTIDGPYYMTEVGEFENSQSPYVTFGQGGNLAEWNETLIGSSRGLRGGAGSTNYSSLEASYRDRYGPTSDHDSIGFRVACIQVVSELSVFPFYNNSAWDNGDLAANEADDYSIAIDKVPLRHGQKATFANYTSYSKGINGLMIDIRGLPGTPTVNDFLFRTGNAVGDSGNSATDTAVNVVDALGVRANPHTLLNPAPIDFRFDYNRDGLVNVQDELLVRANPTTLLTDLNLIDLTDDGGE